MSIKFYKYKKTFLKEKKKIILAEATTVKISPYFLLIINTKPISWGH